MARSFGRCIVVAAIAVLLVSVFCNGCGSTPEAIDVALPGDVGTDTSDGGDMHGLDSEDPDAGCGQCQAGYTCIAGKCTCVPACTGKECGNDGCGGQCGACPAIAPVCVDGLCASDCTADCAGIECGDDGCGGICGECDDDLACTQDSCTSGACAHSVQPFFCVIDNICVPSGTKNPAEPCQVCSPAKEAGGWSQEEDWVPCGTGKVCLAGLCSIDCTWLCKDVECGSVEQGGECECGGCDDGNECTDDSCEENQCVFSANSSVCDDGNPCTGPDKCSEGGCAGAILPPDELVDLDCLCQADVDCQALDDGNACNGNLMCDNSAVPPVCVIAPGSILDCQDDNPCTSDSCDPELGCVFLVDPTGDCSDGNECNGKEACEGGGCVPGAPPVCDDSNPCTTDSCGETAGCTFAPDDSLSCSDGNECNGAEACMSGKCALGQPMACDDNDPCTKDYCVPGLGCQHVQDEAACDDGLFCTNDGCSQGSCVNTLLPFYCIIDGCVPSGAENPLEPCQECLPGQSTTAWSYLADGMPCGTGKVCLAGSCCDHSTNCVGKECGDDGCGGTCGTCLQDWSCQAGLCKQGPCVPACVGKSCGPDGCGGECGTCPASHYCAVQGVCVCLPQCAEKDCGPDGCGGSCGTCQAGFQCDQGKCKQGPCVPNCTGKQCGDDGCGGSCGSCDDGLFCTADKCSQGKCTTDLQPFYCNIGSLCVPDGAVNPLNSCEECIALTATVAWTYVGDGGVCGVGKVCFQGKCCNHAANCTTKECGSDGCGGVCGSCPKDWSCQDGLCKQGPCVPACAGKSCGPDGCGGECGTCPANHYCAVQGVCVCLPQCAGKECGPDACGGSCGTCQAGFQCDQGKCKQGPCVPNCTGKQCGDDGCGGSCGSCDDGLSCTADSCSLGKCLNAIDPFYCVVKGSCVPSGTEDPDSVCRKCLPKKSQTEWSNVDDQTPCGGGGLACYKGVCCIYNCSGKECGSDGCGGSCGSCLPGISCNAGLCNGCNDGNAVSWDGCTNGALSEFQVNTVVTIDQEKPSVAARPEGGYMVVWESKLMGTADIYGRVIADNGTPTGPEFILHASLDNWQHDSRVAALTDGRYVVVWESFVTNQVGASIWAQLINADGTKSGPEIKVNDVDGKWMTYRVDVAALDKGGFVVAWSRNQTWPLTDQSVTVRYRLIAGDGTKLASEGAFGQVGAADPEVATFGDGEFVIACRMGDTAAYPYWQRFNSVGFPLNSATKVADKATLHGISGKSDGQFVIAWNYQDSSAQPKTVFGQLYAKGTGPSGSPFQVSPSNDISNCSYVRPGMRSDGTLVVVWTSVMTGSAQADVWLQRLDAGGLKQGGVLRPNVYTDAWQAQPDVALFGDGNVIVVWASQNQDGDGLGIFARRVDKNGNWLYH